MNITKISRILLALLFCMGMSNAGGFKVHAAEEISRLVLSKNEVSMEVGDTQSLTATAVYVSGKTEDVTVKTDWNSGSPDVASVYAGVVTAKAEGTAVITATYMAKTVVVNVNVKKKVKALTKDKQTIDLRLGKSEQVQLTAVYQDGTTEDVTSKADWSIDNFSIATVTNGLVTGQSSGTATVTAKYGSQTLTIPVSVEIVKRLDPGKSQISLLLKETEKMQLFATYPDGTVEDVAEKAEWSTDKESVADAIKGTITGYGAGQATITAKYGTKTATIRVDVDNAIKLSVDKQSVFMKRNTTEQLTLTATYGNGSTEDITSKAEWSSSNEDVVYADQGKLSAISVGEATVTAKYGEKTVSISVDVEVPRRLELNKELVSLQNGQSEQLILSAMYIDGTKQEITDEAEWSSNNEAAVYVAKGKITAYKAGEATITAKYGGKSVTANVAVDIPNKITPSKQNVALQAGDTEQLKLTATFLDGRQEDVTEKAEWSTASASVAEVRNGLITGVSTGSTTITAKYGTRTATIQVSVGVLKSLTADQTRLVLKKGDTEKISLTATYADGSTKNVADQASWSSSNPQVAAVDLGTITAISSGETTVTATFDNKSVKISVQVDMATSLTASPTFLVVNTGESKKITLTAIDPSGQTKDVTSEAEWIVSNPKLAQVVNGLVTPIANGKITVTAKYGGKTVSIPVEIGIVEKIEANKRFVTTKTGQKVQINVIATFSDGSTRDVTADAEWKSSSYKVADVQDGLLTAIGSGKTTVTAKYEGKLVSIPVEVDVLKYLKTNVVKVNLTVGQSTQVKAFATYIDGSEAEVTKPALWTSSNIMIADVKDGVIKATGKGRATITVIFAGKRTSVAVTVN
jgi:uncharacterized protein YjdB